MSSYDRYRRRRFAFVTDHPIVWGVVALCVLVAAISVPLLFSSYSASHHRTVSICDKSSTNTSNGNEYRIYTSNGTFKVSDKLFVGGNRFNSADVYGRLHTHRVYNLTYHGWRLGAFSEFPNIDRADLVPNAKPSC